MSNQSKNILIVSYVFPPYNGIGGRRWAKFVKYLNLKGIDVSVICAENPFKEKSPWMKDIKDINEKNVYRLPSGYPKYLLLTPSNFLQKILYRLGLAYLKIRTKGNYYDRSVLWKKKLLKKMVQVVKEKNINNILISGGPFMQLFYALEVKRQFPHINFIADIRDPWVNNKTSFGYTEISFKRLEYEKKAEQAVFNNYNYVFTVADDMTAYCKSICQNLQTQFLTLINGYDKEDFEDYRKSRVKDLSINTNRINFVFTGTLYDKSEYIFNEFVHSLNKLAKTSPAIYNAFEFNFYGTFPVSFKRIVKGIERIKYHGTIPLAEVYQKINDADICMLFLTEDLNYSFSTKFYEYISQMKKIAVFSNKGKTGDFVVQNKIGYQITPENVITELVKIYNEYFSGEIINVENLDISHYNISFLTDKIIEHLK